MQMIGVRATSGRAMTRYCECMQYVCVNANADHIHDGKQTNEPTCVCVHTATYECH